MDSIQRTSYRFTTGIVNLPLIFDSNGKKIMENINGKLKPRTLFPKRYLFWEIDYHDEQLLKEVLLIYYSYDIPVYYHKTMKGYHFISIKELCRDIWIQAVKELRHTNTRYPPITLRIKPNKYKDELVIFRKGWMQGKSERLEQLKTWIERQNIGLINMNYYLVKYPMDDNDITGKLTLEQREAEFIQQIIDSPSEVTS